MARLVLSERALIVIQSDCLYKYTVYHCSHLNAVTLSILKPCRICHPLIEFLIWLISRVLFVLVLLKISRNVPARKLFCSMSYEKFCDTLCRIQKLNILVHTTILSHIHILCSQNKQVFNLSFWWLCILVWNMTSYFYSNL